MSLSSRKSDKCYNRGAQKLAATSIIHEATTPGNSLWDYEPDYGDCDSDCLYCNPPIGMLYKNRILLTLLKLRVISNNQYEQNIYI